MKSQGEIEAAVCEGMSHFEQNYMGRGTKEIHAHLINNLVLVRLQGVLTAAEQQLANRCRPIKAETCSNKFEPIYSKRRAPSWKPWWRKSPAST